MGWDTVVDREIRERKKAMVFAQYGSTVVGR